MSSHAWQHTPAEMKAAKEASRKARQEEHNASRKLLRAAERDSQHAAAIRLIDAALVVAERPGQTVPQLSAALETLQQVGVGAGGWQSLVCHMPGYGLPLQEAIARMGACLARMRWRIATQAMSAVEPLLAAGGGDVRETTAFKELCVAYAVLLQLEANGQLCGLAASGLLERVRSPTHSCSEAPYAEAVKGCSKAVVTCTLSPHLRRHHLFLRR